MKYKFGKTIIIALGGSIVHPDGINTAFLKDFKNFLATFTKKGVKFVIVIGGGALARRFQIAASEVAKITDEDKDWIGIHSTRLHAHLLRTVFRKNADPVVIDSRKKISRLRYPITIASGWRPGWSTDYVALQIASDYGIHEVVIAGKPDHVYDKDNVKYADAKPFYELSWNDYQKLIPRKWKPGLHAPVDPVGAALAKKDGVKAIIIDGRDIKNFSALLNGNDFKGTIVGQ